MLEDRLYRMMPPVQTLLQESCHQISMFADVSLATGELCGTSYFLQKLSVAVQLGMLQPFWVVPIHPWIFNNLKWLLLLFIY